MRIHTGAFEMKPASARNARRRRYEKNFEFENNAFVELVLLVYCTWVYDEEKWGEGGGGGGKKICSIRRVSFLHTRISKRIQ